MQPIQHLLALFLNLKWFEQRILESDFERGLDLCGMERLWERDCRCAVTSSWRDATWSDNVVMSYVIDLSTCEMVVLGRLRRTLSAMFARSVREDLSEPAKIARAVGGSTARNERRRMSTFEELPGCKRSRSEQALAKN